MVSAKNHLKFLQKQLKEAEKRLQLAQEDVEGVRRTIALVERQNPEIRPQVSSSVPSKAPAVPATNGHTSGSLPRAKGYYTHELMERILQSEGPKSVEDIHESLVTQGKQIQFQSTISILKRKKALFTQLADGRWATTKAPNPPPTEREPEYETTSNEHI